MDVSGRAAQWRTALVDRGPACAGATDVGPVRERNEDAYWIAEDGSVLVVADGLGGLPGGDMASSLAVSAAAEVFEAGRAGAAGGGLEALAREALSRAQASVFAASTRDPRLSGMATTLVVAIVDGARALVLHVGDSRAALLRGGDFVSRTYDHNLVGDLFRAGAIDAEQARHHPSRNLVRDVVGLSDVPEAECQTWDLEAGDVLLLCTDGVSDALDEPSIRRVLELSPSAAAAAATLVALAGIESGHDNATAVVRYV